MPSPPRRSALLVALAMAAGLGSSQAQTTSTDPHTAILRADNARITTPEQRATIDAALASDAPDIRVRALRAIGRTRRAEFLPLAIAALTALSLDVRREAAFAVASIGSGEPAALAPASRALADALTRETDILVCAALAEEYGRLPFDAADIPSAARALQSLAARLAVDGRPRALVGLGGARGAGALARRSARGKADAPDLVALLASMYTPADVRGAGEDLLRARIRRLAVSGLVALDAVSTAQGDLALADPDAQVRRLGVMAVSRRQPATGNRQPDSRRAAGAPDGSNRLRRTSQPVGRLLDDPAVIVRHAVVSRFGAALPEIATAALGDSHVNIRLAAIDALGDAHACTDACTTRLNGVGVFEDSRQPATGKRQPDTRHGDEWHERAHALVALAKTDAARARQFIARAADDATWQVRMYAARAAGIAKQADVITRLADDAHVNVRHAALVAWREAGLPGATEAAIAALSSDDGQLVLEAATMLSATGGTKVVTAVRAALARITAQDRETSRDPRVALVDAIAAIDPDRDATLRPYLADADPFVVDRVATLLGARPPQRPPHEMRVSVPTAADVDALDRTTVTLRLRGGRAFTLRLYGTHAPAAVARFVAQVREGQWDGLTFHRVEPGFVVQGGSPSANEYAGADAFSRDEFSTLSHVRGTIGISTRGTDTGDGQIFINLVDNARLDFAYTIIGSIVGDASAIDDIVEGDAIETARAFTRQP